jgi:cell division transport system permease protein
MGTIIFFLKEAVRGFYQAKLMTFVSIVSIAVSLAFMSMIVIAFLNVETILRKGVDQADMAAYVKDESADDSSATSELIKRISAQPSVRRVVLIDRDSAWERFSGLYGSEMLEAVDDNPLPASLEIYLADHARSQEEAERLTDVIGLYSEIESVRYSREWIDLVARFRLIFWIVVIVIAAIMNFILYFMISNTIKLTIYARKELIANMQVVGATALFIKMPFLLEGILQGVIGGTLCVAVMGILRLSLMNFPIFWGPQSLPLIIILVGVVYGWMGSAGAVRKFLV